MPKRQSETVLQANRLPALAQGFSGCCLGLSFSGRNVFIGA
jgi:hypothetical protein